MRWLVRFARQRTCAFSFDNFAMENKANPAKKFSCYCKKQMFKTWQWNHSSVTCGSTWVLTFDGIISVVYKSADHENVWMIC